MQISIIGLGWLGLPLAIHLAARNFNIKGSTTSDKKLTDLKSYNISPFKVILEEEIVIGEIVKCLEYSEILILNTPPGLRRNPESNYVAKIKRLIPFIESSSISKVLFIGSTSVFQDGFPIPTITSDTKTNANSIAGKQLREVERLLNNNSNFETTILRFSGLVDNDRHPARMLSKRKDIPNAIAPVNLIHRNDCIGIIEAIIKQSKWGISLNASYPEHPAKVEYYNQICRKLGYAKPDFDMSNSSISGKKIDGNQITELLGYSYEFSIW